VLEVACEDESVTVMLAVPGVAIREAETAAAKSTLSPKVVTRRTPFHSITDEDVNPVPLAKSVKLPSPAIAYVRFSWLPTP